ncbi:hypothetical protein MUK42_25286, partial [Musa troglodytarum]
HPRPRGPRDPHRRPRRPRRRRCLPPPRGRRPGPRPSPRHRPPPPPPRQRRRRPPPPHPLLPPNARRRPNRAARLASLLQRGGETSPSAGVPGKGRVLYPRCAGHGEEVSAALLPQHRGEFEAKDGFFCVGDAAGPHRAEVIPAVLLV